MYTIILYPEVGFFFIMWFSSFFPSQMPVNHLICQWQHETQHRCPSAGFPQEITPTPVLSLGHILEMKSNIKPQPTKTSRSWDFYLAETTLCQSLWWTVMAQEAIHQASLYKQVCSKWAWSILDLSICQGRTKIMKNTIQNNSLWWKLLFQITFSLLIYWRQPQSSTDNVSIPRDPKVEAAIDIPKSLVREALLN